MKICGQHWLAKGTPFCACNGRTCPVLSVVSDEKEKEVDSVKYEKVMSKKAQERAFNDIVRDWATRPWK